MNKERRDHELEVRADDKTIGGYAAVFYDGTPATEYKLWDGCVERVSRDAFRSLFTSDEDIIASYDHDFKTILGRKSSGDLKLSIDERGLKWEVEYDASDVDHQKVLRKIQKKHVKGCSFAFRANKDKWTKDGNTSVRMLEDVDVFELGPVINPCYAGASVGYRSIQHEPTEAKASYADFETQQLVEEIRKLTDK